MHYGGQASRSRCIRRGWHRHRSGREGDGWDLLPLEGANVHKLAHAGHRLLALDLLIDANRHDGKGAVACRHLIYVCCVGMEHCCAPSYL